MPSIVGATVIAAFVAMAPTQVSAQSAPMFNYGAAYYNPTYTYPYPYLGYYNYNYSSYYPYNYNYNYNYPYYSPSYYQPIDYEEAQRYYKDLSDYYDAVADYYGKLSDFQTRTNDSTTRRRGYNTFTPPAVNSMYYYPSSFPY
jgi:hypothetical protein